MTLPFDARALTEPVDRAAARAFWKSIRPAGSAASRLAIIVVLGLTAVFFLMGGVQLIVGVIAAGFVGGGFLGIIFTVLMLGFAAILVVAVVLVARGTLFDGAAVRAYRLDRFARANGMSYAPGLSDPALPGMIFQEGHSRQSSDLVRGQQPRFVEFGNYLYKTGSGKNESTSTWGYVAIKLDAPLPNIVLDAKSNNVLGTNLPASLARGQRLSLEGDFDRYFTLYCPTGYEQDALYLFTPDIMARFIDNVAALDVEIVDDWLFLYSDRKLSTLDEATWRWMFATVGAILDKMAQWARWRDDRVVRDAAAAAPAIAGAPTAQPPTAGAVAGTAGPQHPFVAGSTPLPPPPVVAPEGRRLRRGVTPLAIVVGVVLLGFLASVFAGVFAAFLP